MDWWCPQVGPFFPGSGPADKEAQRIGPDPCRPNPDIYFWAAKKHCRRHRKHQIGLSPGRGVEAAHRGSAGDRHHQIHYRVGERRAPVTSINAGDLVRYLADFEATNLMALPRALVSQQMGWQGEGGRFGFLWGRTLLRPGLESKPSTWISCRRTSGNKADRLSRCGCGRRANRRRLEVCRFTRRLDPGRSTRWPSIPGFYWQYTAPWRPPC